MSQATQRRMIFHKGEFEVREYFKRSDEFVRPFFKTDLGALFDGDCLDILPLFSDDCIDTVFADPPFNLNKQYGRRSNDARTEQEYLEWCYAWLDHCVRVTRPGGAVFVYNIPRWNLMLGAYLLNKGLNFRHAIAIEMKNGLPIQGRLYPCHYSLLYFTKGKPKVFRRIRTPIETCRHCGGEIKDYGGHRYAMNPKGVTLKDIWTDIPPVRHRKFKSDERSANALSTKILDRVIEMSTRPGDLVLDPFGGSGTTYAVSELKQRHWIGIELDFASVIAARLSDSNIEHHKNNDYVED